ncbi:MAG: hypothetical protein KAI47_19640, partial [Deltaproteobacteria bacterium]|nr:hypothetical protein [Deltaproteobacteria bacterium]
GFAEVAHPSDEQRTERVLAELSAPVAALFPVDERIGLEDGVRPLDSFPMALRDALGYAAAQLGCEIPLLRVASKLPSMAPLPGVEAALAVGTSFFTESDPRRLTFVAAQAMCCLAPGRREVFLRRATELKVAFLGALQSTRPGSAIAPSDDRVAAFAAGLAAPRVARLAELLSELFSQGGKFNLSEWMRGVRRTCARLGLIIGGDLMVALAELVDEALLRDDLIDFVLTPSYALLRGERGPRFPG